MKKSKFQYEMINWKEGNKFTKKLDKLARTKFKQGKPTN